MAVSLSGRLARGVGVSAVVGDVLCRVCPHSVLLIAVRILLVRTWYDPGTLLSAFQAFILGIVLSELLLLL